MLVLVLVVCLSFPSDCSPARYWNPAGINIVTHNWYDRMLAFLLDSQLLWYVFTNPKLRLNNLTALNKFLYLVSNSSNTAGAYFVRTLFPPMTSCLLVKLPQSLVLVSYYYFIVTFHGDIFFIQYIFFLLTQTCSNHVFDVLKGFHSFLTCLNPYVRARGYHQNLNGFFWQSLVF